MERCRNRWPNRSARWTNSAAAMYWSPPMRRRPFRSVPTAARYRCRRTPRSLLMTPGSVTGTARWRRARQRRRGPPRHHRRRPTRPPGRTARRGDDVFRCAADDVPQPAFRRSALHRQRRDWAGSARSVPYFQMRKVVHAVPGRESGLPTVTGDRKRVRRNGVGVIIRSAPLEPADRDRRPADHTPAEAPTAGPERDGVRARRWCRWSYRSESIGVGIDR